METIQQCSEQCQTVMCFMDKHAEGLAGLTLFIGILSFTLVLAIKLMNSDMLDIQKNK